LQKFSFVFSIRQAQDKPGGGFFKKMRRILYRFSVSFSRKHGTADEKNEKNAKFLKKAL